MAQGSRRKLYPRPAGKQLREDPDTDMKKTGHGRAGKRKSVPIPSVLFLALSALAFLYGAAVALTGSGTGFFLVWIAAGVFFLVLSLLYRNRRPARAVLMVRRLLTGLLILALALVASLCLVIASGFSANGGSGLSCIIVLGAQVRESGPSAVLQSRLDTAADYLAENEACLCIVSGGQGANEPRPEAEVMRDALVARGIPADRILVENRSKNTAENLRFSAELLNDANDPVGIVTNDFHVARAVRIAAKQGLTNACGIAAPSVPAYLPNNLLRECFGLLKDWIFGNASFR